MVSLKWKDKEQELKQLDKKTTDLSTLIYKQEILIPSIIKSKEKVLTSNQKSINSYESQIKRDQINNLLIYGENKQILSTMLDQYKEKINLIYIDPPFATGGDFNLKLFYSKEKNNYIESLAYDDTWNAGIDSYLSFLYKRLYLMRDLLSPKGSIYLHLDYHVVHYVKIMMDEIFGSENFRNEIIWSYPAASARTKNFYVRSYDSILFYTKTNDYIFNDDENIYMEYSDRVRNSLKEDSNGLFYYRGGSHDGKKLSRKVYVEKNGVFPRDVWKDIPYIRANTKEYQGFSTQKPERLLKRIILASSNKGDLVADFFCGSGTTLVVAEKLDRHWIGCDANWYSINRTKKRLLDIDKSHDMLQWKKKYKKEATPFKILFIKNPNDNFSISDAFFDDQVKKFSSKDFQPELIYKLYLKNNIIKVELKEYKIPFEGNVSKKITKLLLNSLDWIDFWAIDFNYDGNNFIPQWISYRTPKKRELRIISRDYEYIHKGKYEIMIKSIDFLGKEICNTEIIEF